ncbi:MAG: RHS repeat domain-containing protein, partial [Bacteroidia bacterium]
RLLIAFGNDTMTRYCYDANTFRLTRQRSEGYTKTSWTFETAGTVHQDTGYEYDLAGNIIKIKEHTTGCGVGATNSLDRTFNYDPLYRLLQATGRENSPTITPIWDDSYRSNDNSITTFYTQNYQYDKLGNIQQLQHIGNNSFTRNFNYNSNHNKLESIDVGMDNYAFTYDENGNQITENTERHFEWDAADKMRCFFNQAGTAQPSVYSHYLYDASGNRLKKLTRKDSGDKEITIYIDGIFEYRYNIDGSNTLIEEQNVLHVMDDKSRIATKRVGDQFSDDIDSDVIYNLEDHLGSSTVHIGNVGDFISKEEYYPFGETSFGSYAKKRYKYCAKERDNESGLYYYGARYYAAWTCRFVSVDPLAKDYTNLTAYNYAGNKPINYFDIDGMQSSGGDTPTSNNTTPENNNLPTPENKENVINTSSIDNANFTNNIPDNSKQKLASAIYDKIQNLIGLPITSGKEVRLSKETIESHLIKDTTKKDTYFLVLSEDNIFSLSLNKGEIKEEIKEGFTEAIKEPFEKVGEWAAKKLVGKELVEAFKFVSKKANVLTDILDIINKSPVYDEQAIIQMTEIGLERYFIPKDKPIELEPLSPFVPDNTGIGVGFGNFGLQ